MNFDSHRRSIFHYGVVGHHIPNALGRAEVWGNDLIMGTATALFGAENFFGTYAAVIFMHELGHNFGLEHGGGEESHFKPNYYSIMNYMWSTQAAGELGVPHPDGSRKLTYSSEELILNEANLDECAGLPGAQDVLVFYATKPDSTLDQDVIPEAFGRGRANEPIDWNNNGTFEGSSCNNGSTNISSDINGDDEKTMLEGFADWNNDNLKLAFQNSHCVKNEEGNVDDTHMCSIDSANLVGLPNEFSEDELKKLSEELDEAAGSSAVFRVTDSGDVYADGSFNSGSGGFNSSGADIAERIQVSEPVEPGDLVAIDPERSNTYRLPRKAYSNKVVGVISSAPGFTLGTSTVHPTPHSDEVMISKGVLAQLLEPAPSHTASNAPSLSLRRFVATEQQGFLAQLATEDPLNTEPRLALMGRVPVNATAENGPIQPGDLLVSSSKPGYAMRCAEMSECSGTIVGKALEPLQEGTGRILMLVVR